MSEWAAVIGTAVVVFATTNVDDLLLLAGFFSDPSLSARSVIVGQFLGIGALTAASAAAAAVAFVVPPAYVALLGIFPLALGGRGLWRLFRRKPSTRAGGRPSESCLAPACLAAG